MANYPYKIGKATVNITEGGITNAEVIAKVEQLPTATADSPDFVQTSDGVLYRKKAVEVESLLGTWVFNDNITGLPSIFGQEKYYTFSFSSNSENYVKIILGKNNIGYYTDPNGVATTVYTTSWSNTAYKTIQITDISSLTNVDAFTQWLTENAIGGGASVSYEYVAMQEVPTPTTADNGKVLGVTNGAYALQAAGGGGGTTFYKLDAPESTVTTSTGKTINVIPANSSYFGTGSDINEYQDKLISGDLIFIGKLLLDNGKTIQFFAESLRVIVGSGIVIAYTDESILGEYGQSGQQIGVQYFVGGTPIN